MIDAPLPELTGRVVDDPPAPIPPPDSPGWVRFRHWLFEVPHTDRRPLDILRWWERRRIAYNGIVGACGLLTFVDVVILSHGQAPLNELAMASFCVGIAANICYCLGFLSEICVQRFVTRQRRHRIAPLLLLIALMISLLVVLFPAMVLSLLTAMGVKL